MGTRIQSSTESSPTLCCKAAILSEATGRLHLQQVCALHSCHSNACDFEVMHIWQILLISRVMFLVSGLGATASMAANLKTRTFQSLMLRVFCPWQMQGLTPMDHRCVVECSETGAP